MTKNIKEERVLDVIRTEIRDRGCCYLSLAEMAERAGASRSTTSLAIRKAREAGELLVWHRQEQGLSNVIKLPKTVPA